jgi:hypothetical protein
MKTNAYIKNLSVSSFEKKLKFYFKKYPGKEAELLEILRQKKEAHNKFVHKFMGTEWFELILLHLSHTKNFKKMSKEKQNELFVDCIKKILKYIG